MGVGVLYEMMTVDKLIPTVKILKSTKYLYLSIVVVISLNQFVNNYYFFNEKKKT